MDLSQGTMPSESISVNDTSSTSINNTATSQRPATPSILKGIKKTAFVSDEDQSQTREDMLLKTSAAETRSRSPSISGGSARPALSENTLKPGIVTSKSGIVTIISSDVEIPIPVVNSSSSKRRPSAEMIYLHQTDSSSLEEEVGEDAGARNSIKAGSLTDAQSIVIEKNTLRKSSRSNSHTSSNGPLSFITKRLLAWFESVWAWFKDEFFGSIVSFVVFPQLALWFSCAISILTILYCEYGTLSHIYLANALTMWLFVITEATVFIGEWTIMQLYKFQVAWRMAFSSVDTNQFLAASKGAYDKGGRSIWWLLMFFRLSTIALAFLGEWETVDTDLGNFPCIWPMYSQDVFDQFTVSPDVVSGDIDFAQVYNYGLPLADGLLIGIGPWPLEGAGDFTEFSVSGPGPVLALRVECDRHVQPWYGQNQTQLGSGSSISGIFVRETSFNANVNIYYPTAGFNNLLVNTSWVQQGCRVSGLMGSANWKMKYSIDEWQMVTAGKTTQFDLMGEQLLQYNTARTYVDSIMAIINNDPATYYDESVIYESKILNAEISSAVMGILNGTWFSPSQGATFSNFMSWATQPDGYYYANLTARGLAAGIGAAVHQVLLQFDPNNIQTCTYYGVAGAGQIKFVKALEYLSLALAALIMVVFLLYTIIIWLLFPVSAGNLPLFRMSARNMIHETRRIFFMSGWVSRMAESGSNQDMALESIIEERIRFGEKRETMADKAGIMAIGPTAAVVKLRRNRLYFNADRNLDSPSMAAAGVGSFPL